MSLIYDCKVDHNLHDKGLSYSNCTGIRNPPSPTHLTQVHLHLEWITLSTNAKWMYDYLLTQVAYCHDRMHFSQTSLWPYTWGLQQSETATMSCQKGCISAVSPKAKKNMQRKWRTARFGTSLHHKQFYARIPSDIRQEIWTR